ncbi:hypothetical protein ADL19_06590 [Streptomyces purpurogeneiscleroticus]|nr:hypothetical protein ADL19_06590 [Streptomyces purpurogeneiscleroticus]
MKSFCAVIDALSIPVSAEVMGIPESHVRTLKARDSIPADYFKRIVDSEAGRAKGISFDVLYGLLEEGRQRRARRAPMSEQRAG